VPILLATTWRTRLIGLAFRREPPPWGLLFLRCASIHTFGMRFPIDVFFLGPDGSIVRAVRAVPPRRVLVCRRATAVLELPASGGEVRAAEGGYSPPEAPGPPRS
jgi:uncharacterized membrane protein (UPF0127 family)